MHELEKTTTIFLNASEAREIRGEELENLGIWKDPNKKSSLLNVLEYRYITLNPHHNFGVLVWCRSTFEKYYNNTDSILTRSAFEKQT